VEEAYDMEILKISKITSGEIGLLKNADIRLDSCPFFWMQGVVFHFSVALCVTSALHSKFSQDS
jgi:hypothetical protein